VKACPCGIEVSIADAASNDRRDIRIDADVRVSRFFASVKTRAIFMWRTDILILTFKSEPEFCMRVSDTFFGLSEAPRGTAGRPCSFFVPHYSSCPARPTNWVGRPNVAFARGRGVRSLVAANTNTGAAARAVMRVRA